MPTDPSIPADLQAFLDDRQQVKKFLRRVRRDHPMQAGQVHQSSDDEGPCFDMDRLLALLADRDAKLREAEERLTLAAEVISGFVSDLEAAEATLARVRDLREEWAAGSGLTPRSATQIACAKRLDAALADAPKR